MLLTTFAVVIISLGLSPCHSFQCQKNEVWTECVNICNNCEQKGTCNAPPDCQEGCDCKSGHFRDESGYCVQEHQCNAKLSKCPENALFVPCSPSAPPTCENPYPEEEYDDGCSPGCICRPGFLKRRDGKCVVPDQCSVRDVPERPSKCPKNALFMECGSPCPPTCDNLEPQPCEDRCTTACYCKPGYLKRKDGVCVRPEDCDPRKKHERVQPKCPEHAVYIACGSPCPPTCEERYPKPCEEKCIKACYCKPGYLKSKEEKCVKPEHCPRKPEPVQCGADERFYNCTPSCKNTCESFPNPLQKCQCGPPGCFCKEGLIKRADGRCVAPKECPAKRIKCHQNAEFLSCGSSCPPTCQNPRPVPCTEQCVAGCFCKHGFVEEKDGRCVRFENCTTMRYAKCHRNAEFLLCGSSCPPTCQNPRPTTCVEQCVAGCFCKSGFVEDKDGRCVRLENCTKKCKNPGEEFQECGTTCPDTCENRGRPPPRACPYRCNAGCFCRKGLFRTKEGRCKPLRDCPGEEIVTTSAPVTSSTGSNRTDSTTVTAPYDHHGCPRRSACDVYCKSLGNFIGICVGKRLRHCRCT